jgi:hypothetical protein
VDGWTDRVVRGWVLEAVLGTDMDWFRWWHGTVTDPKFQWVSRRCGLSLAEVIAVWACLLECASTATQGNADATRGNVASFDCNDYDVLLGLGDGQVEKILAAMVDKKLIVEGRIAGWDGRQPKREDSGNPNTGALSSTERSRNYREKKRLEETQRNEVQRDATQGNNRIEEIREELKTHTPSMPAQISIVLRRHQIGATPSHPSVIALAEQGVDLETLEACCKEAREAKPNETLSIGYVVKKLEGWKAQARSISVHGVAKAKKVDTWFLSVDGMNAKARELGISGARMGESEAAFKSRIQQAINAREAA